jgi:2-oxoisovalerate dehydrogenase E2 component (dihydrolipoyl transacylase)
MSEFTFKLPDLGEGTVEAEIAEWMVKVGDDVTEEDPICAMLTDKAAVELTSPVSGKVISIAGEEGDMVTVGSALIVFETSGEVAVEAKEQPASAPEEPEAETSAPRVVSGKVATSPSIRAERLRSIRDTWRNGNQFCCGNASCIEAKDRRHRNQGDRPAPQDRRTPGRISQ